MPSATPTAADLQNLLHRTIDLHDALATAVGESVHVGNRRDLLAQGTTSVVHEHGFAILALVREGQLASAAVLLRAQFEALVRALWLHYCAEDTWIERYFAAVQAEPRKDPNIARGMEEMLGDLESGAPARITQLLRPLKTAAWGPLNSFVHSGVHAIVHQHLGPTPDFAVPTLLNSNGLTGMAAMLTAVMSGEPERVHAVASAQHAHLDCLPPIALPP